MSLKLSLFIIISGLLVSCCEKPVEQVQVVKEKIVKKAPDTIRAPTIPDSVCIAAVGDMMLGTSYPDNKSLPPDSAKSSFKNVINDLRSADVKFGNLEGTLLDSGAPAYYKLHQLSKGWLFRMPVSYGSVLKQAGLNLVSLANNHSNDFGEKGVTSTMKALDSLGINYGGILKHPSSVFKINGITYGFCAFAPNAQTLPILDLRNARHIIQDLKQQCDIVIVSFHGGGEGEGFEHVPPAMESFINEKRGNVRAFAHNAIDAGADLILGNGPHVCRAMEVYKNRLIAYSLGNFCTYRCVSVAGVCGMAPLLKVYLNKKGEFLNGRIISANQTHERGLELDTLNRAAKRIQLLTKMDFAQPGLSIGDDGKIIPIKD